METKIPEGTISRLSMYLRFLRDARMQSDRTITSRLLAQELSLTDAQVRRDLGHIGRFGRAGVGYPVRELEDRIRAALGLTQPARGVALAGFGRLGQALASYTGFRREGFLIRAIFDADERKIGQTLDGVKVQAIEKAPETLRRRSLRIGIVAVPGSEAQKVAELLIRGGVTGILNFAPSRLKVPGRILVRNVDMSVELATISHFLREEKRTVKRSRAKKGGSR